LYQNPVLLPAISNQESLVLTVSINDDETGDPITLTDSSGNPLYQVYLEISPPLRRDGWDGPYPSPWYDYGGSWAVIQASLADYLSITGVGTIDIMIPYTVIQTLHSGLTYDVFLRLVDDSSADARQLFLGHLPVQWGGMPPPMTPSGGLT
jgi:hypothetical protein